MFQQRRYLAHRFDLAINVTEPCKYTVTNSKLSYGMCLARTDPDGYCWTGLGQSADFSCGLGRVRKVMGWVGLYNIYINYINHSALVVCDIDQEFEFYGFFSFLKFSEFYEFFFRLKKIRNFANHRCLTCFDVLECNVHL